MVVPRRLERPTLRFVEFKESRVGAGLLLHPALFPPHPLGYLSVRTPTGRPWPGSFDLPGNGTCT